MTPRSMLIGGERILPRDLALREIRNPATQAPLATVADAGVAEVARAIEAASAARPRWRTLAAPLRQDRLASVGAWLRERGEPLAALLARESGAPLGETIDEIAELDPAVPVAAQRVPEPASGAEPSGGIVVVLAAFDRPLASWLPAAVAALAAGDTVIVVASSEAPLAALEAADAFAALPAGVFNLLVGAEPVLPALLAAPEVARILASGAGAARVAYAEAARQAGRTIEFEDVNLEALLVCAGADLEFAAAGVLWACLRRSGQSSVARARVYVESAAAAALADQVHLQAAFLEVGDPAKPETDLGPLISHAALRRAEEQVARALKDGARLKLGGRAFQPWGLPGHFLQPTVLAAARPGSLAARGEILAPVISLIECRDAAAACTEAGSQGARGLAVFAGDAGAALEAARAARIPARHVVARDPRWFPYRDRPGASAVAVARS